MLSAEHRTVVESAIPRLIDLLNNDSLGIPYASAEVLSVLVDDGEVSPCLYSDFSDAFCLFLAKYRTAIITQDSKVVGLLEHRNSDVRAAGAILLSKLGAHG